MTLGQSFKVGVIRLTERFVKSDPLQRRDERRLVKHLNREMGAYLDQIVAARLRPGHRHVRHDPQPRRVALDATTTQPPEDLRNRRVSAKALHRLRKRLVAVDIEERLAMPGLDPRRADLSVAGSVLFDTILRRLGAEEFTLCDLALREGLVLDYIHRNSARIRKVERYPDVRRRSVVELGERCGYWSEHAQQVARLALSIFDQTRSVHGLADREREWLEYGALLHDVGVHISYERHHRHSYYLIKNGDLRGFDPEEIEIIALIARYHRQATPKKSHEGYGDLARLDARDRQGAVGDGPARRRARPQPRAGARRDRPLPARRRLPGAAAHHRRRRARMWAAHRHVGAARSACSASRFASKSPARTADATKERRRRC